MKQRRLLLILCFVLTSFGIASVSAQIQSLNYGVYNSNGTYETNLRQLLSSLPSNVTTHNSFSYNGSIGEAPDRVYAVGMCIPRSTSNDCSDCIKTGSNDLLTSLRNQVAAYSWRSDPTLCHVRYSNAYFLGSLDLESRDLVDNTGDIDSNVTDFAEKRRDLVVRMIAAASRAKRTASSSSDNHFTADVEALTEFQNIYGLMQCSPFLSSRDCERCLQYQSCCGQKQGGVIVRPDCYFRWDVFNFSKAFDNIKLQPGARVNSRDTSNRKFSIGVIVAIAVSIVVVIFIITLVLIFWRSLLFWKRKPYQKFDFDQSGITTIHSLQFDFKTIEIATNKFSDKLGEGGFGEVFKGIMPNGTEVAVKRLSNTSVQGAQEFKNEVVVVAKLQHRNLVKLHGFCLDRKEKILVYEFVPNKSLDYFLFEPTMQAQLDWTKRYNIIWGITRGILYLHEDSRLTIIHRDLKASNVLLDSDMNPKIADFGTVRIFGMDQSRANTNRVVGTRGYMPPEYVMHGHFSTKSDVYSFGVLVLEIISGRKNIFLHQPDTTVENLVTYAWRLWKNGTPLELVDPTICENCPTEEVKRCIHIALLCVQHDPTDRPNLSTIYMMLDRDSINLPVPRPPGFFFPNTRDKEGGLEGFESSQSTNKYNNQSINDVTFTELEPR